MTLRTLLLLVCILYCSIISSQTYSFYVGETKTLPQPTPPAGAVEAIGVGQCSKSDCVSVSGLKVYVHKYFSGTATVSVEYSYSFIGSYSKKKEIETTTAYYSIKCEPISVNLNKSEVTINVNEDVELSYSTIPEGLEPSITWTTSDKSVAFLQEDNKYSFGEYESIPNAKKNKSYWEK